MNPRHLIRLVAFAALILVPIAPDAAGKEPSTELSAKIDQILSERFPTDEPGAAVIVTKDGETILRKGYGMANLELDVPIQPDMVFRVGSVTKQFTAVSILMLVEEGKISIDDPIEKFLPEYPTQGKNITIEHLLTHTSGIKSYTNQEQFIEKIREDYTVYEMIDRFKNEPMEFDPGEKWNYSNSGYFLLGAIIEKVSGMTWADFLRTRIFDIAGMKNTYASNHARIIPRRVSGYEMGPDGWDNASYLSMSQPYAAGAILSTIDDLAKWDAALYTEKLVSPASLEKAWTAFTLADGSSTGYGYGWTVGEWKESRVIEHGGGINGFLSSGIRMPNEKVYVAVLMNSSGVPPGPGPIAQKIATVAAGKPWDPKAVDLPEDVLKRYAGVYRIDDETTRVVTVESGKLFTQRSGGTKSQALPMSDHEFFYPESFNHFTIDFEASGNVSGMTMHSFGGPAEAARYTAEKPERRAAIEIDPALLDHYLGRYELGPGFILTVTREGDQLRAQATAQPKFEIFAESETIFFLKVVDAQIEFTLGEDGIATGLTLHQGGRDIPAKKLD